MEGIPDLNKSQGFLFILSVPPISVSAITYPALNRTCRNREG
jgi:hypothetical protein